MYLKILNEGNKIMKIKMKYIFIIPLLISLLFFSCSSKKGKIVIGAIMNLTGDTGVYGQWAKSGVDLAVEQINSRGGINGKLVKIEYEDDQAIPSLGISAFNKLVNINNIQAIIGPLGSSVTLAVAPLANKNKVVIISPISSNPKITNAGDYVFRIWPSDNIEGSYMAEYAKNILRYNNIAIYYMNNDYGVGLREVFKEKYNELGGKVIIDDSFNTGETNFRTTLNKIKSKNPDAIYIPGHLNEVAKIIKQIKELGIKVQLLTTSAVDGPEIIQLGKDAAEGIIFTSPTFDPESNKENVRQFQKEYQKKYEKRAEIVAAHAYDVMNIYAKILSKVDYNGQDIKEVLSKLKDYEGVTGVMSFDRNGDIEKGSFIKKIINGKITIIYGQ